MSIYEVTAAALQLWPDPVLVSNPSCALALICMGGCKQSLDAFIRQNLHPRDAREREGDCLSVPHAALSAEAIRRIWDCGSVVQ